MGIPIHDPDGAKRSALNVLHAEIDGCTRCADVAPGFKKIQGLDRGDPGSIVLVGQGPGRTEKSRLKAFSGTSGTRLEKWLVACGANPDNPRENIYFTSVTKCEASALTPTREMIINCRPFLRRQLEIIKPKVIITLGRVAYEVLSFADTKFAAALCIPVFSRDLQLITPFGFHFALLPWPHPSGLNRWPNDPENKRKLEASFTMVKSLLEENSDE